MGESIIWFMLLKNVKLLFTMTLFESRRFVMFPSEVFASILARLIDVTLYITFWLLVSKYAGSGNINPRQIISYYLIINGITSFFFTQLGIASQLIKLIKYGELNQTLIRPVSPILVPWSQRAGRNMLNQILGGVQVILGVIIAGGLTFHSGLLFPLVFINTVVLNLSFNIIVGTLGFYFIEAGGVKNTFVHIYNLLGGVLMPLFLMPVSVATALQFTPFPAAQYHMAMLLQGINPPSSGFVCIGLLWSVFLTAFAAWFWRRSLCRYEAVGI